MNSVRIDKWLWAARFFKTRGLAARACELGRVQSNGLRAKPAREVHAGDRLRVENEGGVFEIEVLELSDMRGPAAVAQKLYHESDASREARHESRRRSAKRCRNSRPRRSAGRRSGTGATSSAFAAKAEKICTCGPGGPHSAGHPGKTCRGSDWKLALLATPVRASSTRWIFSSITFCGT